MRRNNRDSIDSSDIEREIQQVEEAENPRKKQKIEGGRRNKNTRRKN
jgi:hypothetical protein